MGSTNDCYYLLETSSSDKSLCLTTFITATAASMVDELLVANRGTMSTDEVIHKYLLHYMMSISPSDLSLVIKVPHSLLIHSLYLIIHSSTWPVIKML